MAATKSQRPPLGLLRIALDAAVAFVALGFGATVALVAAPAEADEPPAPAPRLALIQPVSREAPRYAFGCAGDGEPRFPLELSALGSAAAAYAGPDAVVRTDDLEGSGVTLRVVRLGVCGRLATRAGALLYRVVLEPWQLAERARADAEAFGRFTAAEIGYAPWSWLTVWGGIHRVAFSYGHDEPEQVLTLPERPYVSQSLAPDRRLGLTLDSHFGAARIIVGLYQAERNPLPVRGGGVLITDRLVAEPIGPVGPTVSTVDDAPLWRRRMRVAINASGLYERIDGVWGYALGGDVAAKWGPLGIVAEYLYARRALDERPTSLPAPRLDRQGAFVQAALMLLRPYLELEARYDWLSEPNVILRGRFHAVTAGLTLYAVGTRLRLQASYARKIHVGTTLDDQVALGVVTLAY